MSRLLKVGIFMFVLLVGLIFHLRNEQNVVFDYYLGTLELPLSAGFVIVLAIGVALGALAGVPALLKLKRENARLLRQIALSEQEINALRVIPVKDGL